MALRRVCVELGANYEAGVGLIVDPARQGGQEKVEMDRLRHHAQMFHSLLALAIAVTRVLARRLSFRIVRVRRIPSGKMTGWWHRVAPHSTVPVPRPSA